MIIGMSKELYKVKVYVDEGFNLEKLQSHEILGLYLIGEISFSVLQSVFRTDKERLNQFINTILDEISHTSFKDDSQVELDV